MAAAIISFAKAIEESKRYSKRHLILGNGFSIGCRSDIFRYDSLYGRADFTSTPQAQSVFKVLETQDFEVAIRALERASLVIPLYISDSAAAVQTMRAHAERLKDVLIATIAENHPSTPNEIADEEFRSCRLFLRHFLGESDIDGYVFTLNYDLLLYWALMHDDGNDGIALKRSDGFGNDEDDPDADYVDWQGENVANKPNVLFLHGALHLFDAGAELQKYTWVRRSVPLVEQARSAISDERFPLFVAEGTSRQKKREIRHNAYLYQCFKLLGANAAQRNHCFFVFGHSLAENDEHILTRLVRGKFPRLYVGIFGDPTSAANARIVARARRLEIERGSARPLEVVFFDSATAQVWGR